MIEEIEETIEVLASFGRHGLRPRLFIWSNRRYAVSRITASWVESAGLFHHYCFAVLTDGANLYELCFQPRDLLWRLRRIHHD